MRADQLLVERGLAATRSQAQRLIAAGVQWRLGSGAWRRVGKNGEELRETAELQLLDAAEQRYVSRGGLKLEGALAQTAQPVEGLTCLDVGQSTGGFTDCLLQRGAALVVGVDVGHGQLHPALRADARVRVLEKFNARELDSRAADAALAQCGVSADLRAQGFDLVVGDLSFISLTLVLPALVPRVRAGGHLLLLVKPQFELQPAQIGKGGLVKDPTHHALVAQRLRQACEAAGLVLLQWLDSPIEGGDGNREFFVWARKP
jgi:23S rRNA (cytidine1920-2'-O)/16S rRNA (cytidine1409-2'-O)-methyltransferase